MQTRFFKILTKNTFDLFVGLCFATAGCASHGKLNAIEEVSVYRAAVVDIREVMLASARSTDRHFPSGEGRSLTTFAYIGTVKASDALLRVVYCQAVTNGMPSPRGSAWIAFFDDDGRWLTNRRINFKNPPLWCDNGGIYFYGVQTVNGTGNYLDLNYGLAEARLVQRVFP